MNLLSAIISQLQLTPAAATAYQQLLRQLLKPLLALPRPVVIGITGAQGTGKSTLASVLTELLMSQGIAAGSVSLDDYYLSKAQRRQLAEKVHPVLAQRGVPGTHNIAQALADARAVLAGQPIALPQFDKALDEPAAALPAQTLDILIVEGWCLGVPAQTEAELATPVNELEATTDADGRWRHYVNQQLAGLYAEYWRLMTPLIWLQAPDWDCVCRWRAQQEHKLSQSRGKGMTEAELARFMLPFQRLTLASWQQLPAIASYTVLLDQQHLPTLLAAD
ncbi:D-glycerate 3-kinase [Arsukibacterium tuosuense]|uniref:D-glycerate 3-kinase n=1 Tax=Arsukibacterium tuosuense TaxID=1323745 RepID=A0A285IMC8_9GAMM|nr:ATP-binding cassette domain-containing protein [Arsukibacterium tuosuense]SNY49132.1 D-glycerate 3-kinase [Arsukibacterium tuosuense]